MKMVNSMKTTELDIRINRETVLKGNLNVPYDPLAFVVFSHGSGSSRFSTRNRYVAEFLNAGGIATLLTDLLTEDEDRVYQNRFNIELLTARLVSVTDYASQLSDLRSLPAGYFGASTGAASALRAAAIVPGKIQAVVSRGGRPDLAADLLPKVEAPTLLIVGGLDTQVIVINQNAYLRLTCEKDLRIVKGASHLFEEQGTLEAVANLAGGWFNKYLVCNPITK